MNLPMNPLGIGASCGESAAAVVTGGAGAHGRQGTGHGKSGRAHGRPARHGDGLSPAAGKIRPRPRQATPSTRINREFCDGFHRFLDPR